uniref:GPI ethanolamine phosphate transferase 1 n=1 Tax=Peronospora matthiolae TaxID=2874970 RepID=A0AAV1UA77_9STRA
MAVFVYSHCILGILNYPMAIFGAIPMAHFASIVPFTTASQAKRIWNCFWLIVSSPLVLLVLLNWTRMDVIGGLSYTVDSFAHRTNLLALPYMCCIYVCVHTLSLVIWVYPPSLVALPLPKKSKKE